MTEEEYEQLKSTVKQWLFHTGSLDPAKYANELKLKFIEPREKRIAELIDLIHAERKRQEQCDDIHLKKIADLEKENAELKVLLDCKNCSELLEEECEVCAEASHFKCKGKAHLTKAKDLIKNIIRVTWGEGWNYSLDWKVQAEQFLKEIEK